jgi:hypothetical protein
MAYWFPEFSLGFQCHIPEDAEHHHIFYFEVLAVTCTILNTSHSDPHLVIYSDNHNTVDIWHLLKACASYNQLLILGVDELIKSKIDACVLHVPGIINDVANTSSHFENKCTLRLIPHLKIYSFKPPHGMLGAAKK